jgi:hypothetical protein
VFSRPMAFCTGLGTWDIGELVYSQARFFQRALSSRGIHELRERIGISKREEWSIRTLIVIIASRRKLSLQLISLHQVVIFVSHHAL